MTIEIAKLAINGVLAASAAIGAVVAVMGLNAWKKELRGRNEYVLVRRCLRAMYEVRDAIRHIRNPWISYEEMVEALEKTGKDSSLISNHKQTNIAVYSTRWERVRKALSDLDVETREAEVIWGKEIVERQEDLRQCSRTLFAQLKMFIEGDVRDPAKIDEIIYDTGENSEFNEKVKRSVEKIERYLSQYLG